jgi:hypothetical protein
MCHVNTCPTFFCEPKSCRLQRADAARPHLRYASRVHGQTTSSVKETVDSYVMFRELGRRRGEVRRTATSRWELAGNRTGKEGNRWARVGSCRRSGRFAIIQRQRARSTSRQGKQTAGCRLQVAGRRGLRSDGNLGLDCLRTSVSN